MAYVISPDGTPGEVPDEQVQMALSQGFKLREPDTGEIARAAAGEQPLVAGAESAVRTLLPVVGQELLTGFQKGYTGKSEEEVLKAQQTRKEENPVSSAIGTGLGFAAGPGKLLKPVLAPLRAAGILGQVGAGATEGGLFGLEEAVNESMVDQTPLTSEKVAASVAGAALTGGVIDFGTGMLAKGGSALIKNLGSRSLKEGIEAAGDSLVKNQIISKSQLKKYDTAEFIDEIVKFGRKEGIITPATTYESGYEAAKQAVKARQPVYDLILDGLEGIRPATSEAKEVLNDVQQALKKYDRSLLGPVADQQLKRVESVLMQPGLTWRELHKVQSDLFAEIPPTGAASGVKKVLDNMQEALQQSIEKRLNANLTSLASSGQMGAEMEALGIGKEGFIKKLSREYAQAKRLESMFEDQMNSAASRGVGIKEMAVAGALGAAKGGPAGAGIAVGGALLGKQVRERGGFILGGALNKLAESEMLPKLAESFHRNVLQRLATAPELLGPFRYTLEQAASQGAMDTLQTHVDLVNSRQGEEYKRRMGIVSDPASSGVVNEKLAVYDAVRQATVEYDRSLESAVSGVFGSAPGRKGSVSVGSLSQKDFERTTAHLQKILRDPESVYAQVPPELRGAAPGTAGSTVSTLLNAARFLDAKAPKDPNAGMPVALATPWQPSPTDLDQFNRYKEAVENPVKVLKNMANGYISPEQVEAIQTVYPAIYQDLQQKISDRLMMYKKPLTFQQKQAFSTILGSQALGMSQAQMQILQGLQSQTIASPSGPGSVPKQDGRQDVDQEKNLTTQAQRLEER